MIASWNETQTLLQFMWPGIRLVLLVMLICGLCGMTLFMVLGLFNKGK